MFQWFEDLPEKCPPQEAHTSENRKFYRLATANPPNCNDFRSQRLESPTTEFPNISECIARAISIWESSEKCSEQKKFPRHKNKIVVEITLTPNDGLILQTFRPLHYSWWRSGGFSPELATMPNNNV